MFTTLEFDYRTISISKNFNKLKKILKNMLTSLFYVLLLNYKANKTKKTKTQGDTKMKTNQLKEVINGAEGIVIKGKSQKQEVLEIAATVNEYLNENGVNVTEVQSEIFVNEYLEKRKLGLK